MFSLRFWELVLAWEFSFPSKPTVPIRFFFIHGVLNDSFFTAVVTFDDNRHLFFQDINGSIRYISCLFEGNIWFFIEFLPTISPPKNSTPLEVYLINTLNQLKLMTNIFYVGIDGHLAVAMFILGPNDMPASASPFGKKLSVIRVIINNTEFDNNGLLFYSDKANNITGLYGSCVSDQRGSNGGSGSNGSWSWLTISGRSRIVTCTKRWSLNGISDGGCSFH